MAEWILGSTILVDALVGLLRQCECICCSLEIGIVYVRHDISTTTSMSLVGVIRICLFAALTGIILTYCTWVFL